MDSHSPAPGVLETGVEPSARMVQDVIDSATQTMTWLSPAITILGLLVIAYVISRVYRHYIRGY